MGGIRAGGVRVYTKLKYMYMHMYMYVLAHVFSVLIRNIIKIRIIHNTRRFARYYATLPGMRQGVLRSLPERA